MLEQIVVHLEKQTEEMCNYLQELVEMESPSMNKQLVDQVAEWLAKNFQNLTGGSAEIIQDNTFGNHVKCQWGNGEKQILVLGHMDTVWPEGTIETMPFRIKDDKVFGPGVFDMKGGLIQGLFALKALKELEITLNKKVVFLIDSDEEIGNPSSRAIIEKEAKKSDAVFVLEPAIGKKGSLKTSRKGVGIFHLEVTGIAAHAGIEPQKGVSAIEELAHQIIKIQSMNDLEKGTTFNVGTISGGSTINVVPEKAYAEVDVRVKTKSEMEKAIASLQKLKPVLKGTSVSITGGANRMSLERTEEVAALFRKAKQLAGQYLHIELTERGTGGGSDGNLTAPFAPTLDGLGAVGDGAHANHEHLLVNHMPKRSALLAMLLAICGK